MSLAMVNNVVVGEGGELFLCSDRHFTLDLLLGRKSVDKRSIENFTANLERRRALSQACGARYVHLVAPDKHVVLREKFPLKQFLVLGEVYADRSGASFLYPVDELRRQPGSYSRTDTHWSVEGTIIIAELLATTFGIPGPVVREGCAALRGALVRSEEMVAGDLGVKLDPPHLEPKEHLELPWKVHTFSNGVRGGNDGRIIATVSESPLASGRLVIFGDSFLALGQAALTAFFKEILFCRTRYYHEEIVRSARPDFVVSENVERYLSAVASDADAVPMLLMAQMLGRDTRYRPGHARAIGALLSPGTRAYRDFLKSLVASREVAPASA